MKDDETGVEPVSADGEGASDDELAQRRHQRGGSAATRGDLAAEQAKLDAENGALREGDGEENDGQLFVWEQGRKVTLGTLIARGTPVEHAVVFGGKRLKGSGGLPALDADVLSLTRSRPGKVSIVPTRDDEEKVTKCVIEVHFAAKSVVNADSDEALSWLAPILEARGWRPPAVAA